MASSKFNMNSLGLGSGLLNEKSQELKEGFEIQYIPLLQIEPNKKNKYSMSDIEGLAEEIKTVGLKQNLDLLQIGPKKYKILTGHRRYEAYKILSLDNEKYNQVPCTISDLSSVKLPLSDESKEQYLINITNASQRQMTESDKFNQYLDLKGIYIEAQKNGFVLSGRRRDLIASDMSLSTQQIGKYDYIDKHGTEELKQAIKTDNISINQAAEIAHVEPTAQKKLLIETKENVSSKDNDSAEEKQRQKKQPMIDTLKQSSYQVNNKDLVNIQEKFSSVITPFENAISFNKKDYAKLLTAKEKIIIEFMKIEALIEKNSK